MKDSIHYIGVDDKTLDLFESQYKIPNGVSYNSYLIEDEKIAVMDTVDSRAGEEWFKKLDAALDGKKPDYLVVLHMEPDHSANIQRIAEKYPDMKIVGNAKTFTMIKQFFDFDTDERCVVVKEGDEVCLGEHTLTFVMAPMVHWPEAMVAYEKSEKILFSADAFGKFGALDTDEEWLYEARRYYLNIVGKYGVQVQALLKKAAALDIQKIYPLHGPVLTENLSYYISKYDIWSRYEPEEEGIFIAYASIHGNTAAAAKKLASILKEKGAENVITADLSRYDISQAVANAFRYSKLVAASATYDGGLFPCMEDFIAHLKAKNYQKRKVALVENGTWAPMAAKHMREAFCCMNDIEMLEPAVTVKSALKPETVKELEKLADALI